MKFKVVGKHVTSSGNYLDGVYENGDKVVARDWGHAEIGDFSDNIWQGDDKQYYKIYNNGVYMGRTKPFASTDFLIKD